MRVGVGVCVRVGVYDTADTIKLPKIDIFLISEYGQYILTALITDFIKNLFLVFFII